VNVKELARVARGIDFPRRPSRRARPH